MKKKEKVYIDLMDTSIPVRDWRTLKPLPGMTPDEFTAYQRAVRTHAELVREVMETVSRWPHWSEGVGYNGHDTYEERAGER